jgi:NADH-quinone oxidoreductase subunit A
MDNALELFIFLAMAATAISALLLVSVVVRVKAKKQDALKHLTYECGEADTSVTWVRFHARYYVVALFFVLFDIEAAFLYPWGTVVRELGARGLVAIFSFVAVLMLGWVWAQKKGALQWQ